MTGSDKPLVNIFGELIKDPDAPKRPGVRYSRKVFEELCTYISEGMTTVKACSQPGMPAMRTLYEWLAASDMAKEGEPMYGLSLLFTRAHDIRMELKEHSLELISALPRIGEIEEIEYERRPAFLEDGNGQLILGPNGEAQPDPDYPDGWKNVEVGRKVKRVDMVERSRLHANSVQWIMARRSRKYASDTQVKARMAEANGEGSGNTLEVIISNAPPI